MELEFKRSVLKQLKYYKKKNPEAYKIIVGNFRIIFYISEEKEYIEIIDIIHRKDNYNLF